MLALSSHSVDKLLIVEFQVKGKPLRSKVEVSVLPRAGRRPRALRGASTWARRRTLAVVAVVLPALALPAAASAQTLVGGGSSAAQPYMLELFKAYSKTHKRVQFKYIANGGNAGVQEVQAGRFQFAINTRPPEPSDGGTSYVKLFLDGLCVAVNKDNSLSNITTSNLKNIFLGVDTNWSQVAGSNLSTTIDPIGRNSAAGQYTFFQQSVLGGADAGRERPPGHLRRPRADRGREGPQLDRIRRSRTLRQPGQEADDQRQSLRPGRDQERELPAVPLRLGRVPDEGTRARRCSRSSAGCGPAPPPGRSSTKPARLPRSTSSSYSRRATDR